MTPVTAMVWKTVNLRDILEVRTRQDDDEDELEVEEVLSDQENTDDENLSTKNDDESHWLQKLDSALSILGK